jgi:hypothetical protein
MDISVEKLLTVEDTFQIKDRGVVVIPAIPKSRFRGESMRMFVLLRRPDGIESRVLASFSIPRVTPPQDLCFACLIEGATKEDIPVGSEIFRFVDANENA